MPPWLGVPLLASGLTLGGKRLTSSKYMLTNNLSKLQAWTEVNFYHLLSSRGGKNIDLIFYQRQNFLQELY